MKRTSSYINEHFKRRGQQAIAHAINYANFLMALDEILKQARIARL